MATLESNQPERDNATLVPQLSRTLAPFRAIGVRGSMVRRNQQLVECRGTERCSGQLHDICAFKSYSEVSTLIRD